MPHWYGIQDAGTPDGWKELAHDPDAWRAKVEEIITAAGGVPYGTYLMVPDPDDHGDVDDTPSWISLSVFSERDEDQAREAYAKGLSARRFGKLVARRP